jgi:hypothetical protein
MLMIKRQFRNYMHVEMLPLVTKRISVHSTNWSSTKWYKLLIYFNKFTVSINTTFFITGRKERNVLKWWGKGRKRAMNEIFFLEGLDFRILGFFRDISQTIQGTITTAASLHNIRKLLYWYYSFLFNNYLFFIYYGVPKSPI